MSEGDSDESTDSKSTCAGPDKDEGEGTEQFGDACFCEGRGFVHGADVLVFFCDCA